MDRSEKMKMLGFSILVVALSVTASIETCYAGNKANMLDKGNSEKKFPTNYENNSNRPKLNTDFTVAAEMSVNAVVHIKTKLPGAKIAISEDPFFEYFFRNPQFEQKDPPIQEGSGSGVIITDDGYIVTNNHVIDKSSDIEVILNDKRSFKAKLIGADPATDIALLKIEAEKLPIMPFGDSDSLKVGEWVLAIGNPFNLTSTVTAGIVSAKARNIDILSNDMKIESFIQTDAAINPGNSGGALVNTEGELVGINTAIASQTGSYTGYGFAIPSGIVQKVVSDLRQYGIVQRAILGVQIRDINSELAKEKNLKTLEGVYVASVMKNSAAEKAGIKDGDIITHVNGNATKSVAELQEQISRHRPGDKVLLQITRNEKNLDFSVELKNQQGSTDIVSSEANISKILGATFKEIDNRTKEQLGLNYGVQIASLNKGKLQEQGIKNGYIIIKINDQEIHTKADIQSVFDNASREEKNKVLFIIGVYPNGMVAYYAINLDK